MNLGLRIFGLATVLAGTLSATTFQENFDNVGTLTTSGFSLVNNSLPLGGAPWFQGNSAIFSAYEGADSSYLASNFLATGAGGNLSVWLLTPLRYFNNGDSIRFFARLETSLFTDSIEVRFAPSTSTSVGAPGTGVGAFTNLLLTASPLTETWTEYSATLSGLSGETAGRFAIRYFGAEANSNYIGIDSLSYTGTVVPEPGTLVTAGLVFAAAALRLRQSR